jgi:hypothetical protein
VDAKILRGTCLRTRIPVRLSLLLLLAVGARLPATEPEDELRAATVLAFLRNAEWSTPPTGTTLTVGVAGRASMVQALQRSLDGKTAHNRTVRVLGIRRPSECQECQAVYLAIESRSEVKQLLAGIHSAGLLSIGESEHFLDSGGAVQLVIQDGHIGFEVSHEVLVRSAVSISSKLLRYGRVRGGPPE